MKTSREAHSMTVEERFEEIFRIVQKFRQSKVRRGGSGITYIDWADALRIEDLSAPIEGD